MTNLSEEEIKEFTSKLDISIQVEGQLVPWVYQPLPEILKIVQSLVDKKVEEHISKKVLFDAIDQLMPEPEEINFKEDNYESGRRDALIDLQDLI